MADLSKIKINGTPYNLKDSEARDDIEDLQNNKTNGAYTLVISNTPPASGTADNIITFVVYGNE